MRLTKEEYFMELARIAACRTTCLRRGVGCVLIDGRHHVMSIGYNGVASGLPHCNEVKQRGADYKPWGKPEDKLMKPERMENYYPHACPGQEGPGGKDTCEAVHAEQNALLQCGDPWQIEMAFCTRSPCKNCLKLLLNTSCKKIVFLDEHSDPWPREQWLKAGREWLSMDEMRAGRIACNLTGEMT